MRVWAVLLSVLVVSHCDRQPIGASGDTIRRNGGGQPVGVAGEYNFTIFSRFWQGEPANEIPCGSFAASNLTVHGIWPMYSEPQGGHLWPQFCNSSSAVTAVLPEVTAKMLPEWRRVAQSYPANTGLQYTNLASHEWERHGTCWSSAVNQLVDSDAVAALQEEFFQQSINLIEDFPTPVLLGSRARAGKTIPLANLQEAFGGPDHVALQCTSGGQLAMVSLCFDKKLERQVACPPAVLAKSNNINNCAVPTPVSEIGVAFQCSKNAA